MRRAGRILALVAALCAGGAAAQQELDPGDSEVTLDVLTEHLRGIRRGWARVEQVNSDGTISNGVLLIDRPWKARLEYAPPNIGLVIADSTRVAIIDPKSNSNATIIPLKRTPLYYILDSDIDLSNPELLINYRIGKKSSEVALRSPQANFPGYVTLGFVNDPLRLIGWTFVDELGQQTRINLGEFGDDIDISPELFDIDDAVRLNRRN